MINGKPVVVITMDSNNLTIKPGQSRHLDCPKPYFHAIARAGGIPVGAGEFCAEELCELADALLLTGGDDLQPELYGEEKHTETVRCDVARDEFEIPLVKLFLKTKKPILGICRGIQVLSTVLGGTIHQDLVEDVGVQHMEGRMRHEVTARPGSFFYETFGEKFRVNSTHHEAVNKLGSGLTLACWTCDGVVEAFDHPTLPYMGTQFHPERMTGVQYDGRTQDFFPVFEHFIAEAKKCAEQSK